MIGIILTVVLLGIIVSTPETRAAGRRAARPIGYAMALPGLFVWATLLWQMMHPIK